MPGTGKTATVTQVMRELRQQQAREKGTAGGLPPFTVRALWKWTAPRDSPLTNTPRPVCRNQRTEARVTTPSVQHPVARHHTGRFQHVHLTLLCRGRSGN